MVNGRQNELSFANDIHENADFHDNEEFQKKKCMHLPQFSSSELSEQSDLWSHIIVDSMHFPSDRHMKSVISHSLAATKWTQILHVIPKENNHRHQIISV